jgi:flagellar biosynthesis/type III secretory pathway protein FliH
VKLHPFLATIAEATAARPFGTALPVIKGEPATSPWSPKPQEVVPVAPTAEAIVLEAIRAEAAERGLADGLRETEALRAKLTATLAQLEAARAAIVAPTAERIATAAAAIVEAWTGAIDRKELFAPIVAAWLAQDHGAAIVRVNPGDVEAMRTAIGEASMVVEPDPALAGGDVKIESATFELAHRWADRLHELRTTIASAL